MSRTVVRGLLAPSYLGICSRVRASFPKHRLRCLSATTFRAAENPPSTPSSSRPPSTSSSIPSLRAPRFSSLNSQARTSTANPDSMSLLSNVMKANNDDRQARRLQPGLGPLSFETKEQEQADAKVGGTLWFLHIYTHKHNAHITLSQPNHNPVLSLSCGNIGFKHSARKTFDAGFQLAVYTFNKIKEMRLAINIQELELVFRGYGKARDAIAKVLMSADARFLAQKIIKVSDSTRLKFGGVRSKNKRRI